MVVGLRDHGKIMKINDDQIVKAIEEAEMNTSGEIRVHISKMPTKNVYEAAVKTFEKLGMTNTQERNGVLIYLSTLSHQFAIIGDQGIHDKVHQEFWDEVRNHIVIEFKKNDFTKGLCDGILACGQKLKQYFPRQHDDKNELSNTVSRD